MYVCVNVVYLTLVEVFKKTELRNKNTTTKLQVENMTLTIDNGLKKQ